MDNKNKKAIEIYDVIAEDYARRFDSIESDADMIFPNTFLSYLSVDSDIVDLGCGTGFTSGYFQKNGMKSEGVDLSKSMINIASRNYSDIKFSVDDMRTFSPGRKVDAVWAGYSLYHFKQESFENTLEKIKTYLKSDGILGIVMQEGEGEIENTDPFIPEEKIYIHLYTEKQLREILSKHGFEVIEQKRKMAGNFEFPYNKILLISKLK